MMLLLLCLIVTLFPRKSYYLDVILISTPLLVYYFLYLSTILLMKTGHLQSTHDIVFLPKKGDRHIPTKEQMMLILVFEDDNTSGNIIRPEIFKA